MPLTDDDVAQIRQVVREELHAVCAALGYSITYIDMRINGVDRQIPTAQVSVRIVDNVIDSLAERLRNGVGGRY